MTLDLNGIDELAGKTTLSVTESVLSGNVDDKNLRPTVRQTTLQAKGEYVLPKYSFTVLRIKAGR